MGCQMPVGRLVRRLRTVRFTATAATVAATVAQPHIRRAPKSPVAVAPAAVLAAAASAERWRAV